MSADFPMTEEWFLAVTEGKLQGRSTTMCQIRSYAENVEGLKADFERSVMSVPSGPSGQLLKETVSTDAELKKYIYYPEAKDSFYNVWERRLNDGEFVFALSKTNILNP